MKKKSVFFLGMLGLGIALYSIVVGAVKPSTPQYDWEKMRKNFAQADVKLRKLLLQNAIEVLKHVDRSQSTHPSAPVKKSPQAIFEFFRVNTAWGEELAEFNADSQYCFMKSFPGYDQDGICYTIQLLKDKLKDSVDIQCRDEKNKTGDTCNPIIFGAGICFTTQSALFAVGCSDIANKKDQNWHARHVAQLAVWAANNTKEWQYFQLTLKALAQLCIRPSNPEACRTRACRDACAAYSSLLAEFKRLAIVSEGNKKPNPLNSTPSGKVIQEIEEFERPSQPMPAGMMREE